MCFKIVGEYKGIIKNGFILAGESFFPGRKRAVTLDAEQLKKVTQGEENGWFVIHSCEPENPFLKKKVEEVKKETLTEEVKAEISTEVIKEEAPVEEIKEEAPVEEVKEEAPKKKTAKSKKKAEETAK